jgi:hypothetical protein
MKATFPGILRGVAMVACTAEIGSEAERSWNVFTASQPDGRLAATVESVDGTILATLVCDLETATGWFDAVEGRSAAVDRGRLPNPSASLPSLGTRLAVVLLVAVACGCGGDSHEPQFQQLVPEVNRAFEECHAGRYPPAEPASDRAAAISACQACWLDEEREGIACNDETGRLCRELLGLGECECEWVTTFAVEADCRECLRSSCGVEAVTEDSQACAWEH